jgi:uncharacterized protein YcbK (DUF882 family)
MIMRLKMRSFCLILSAVLAMAAALIGAQKTVHERTLSFYNIHTGAHLTVTYRRGNEYDPEGLAQINHILRDHVCGDEHSIDPLVLDFLYDLMEKLGYHREVQMVCGYRSVETNTMMHYRSKGVALESMHTQGRALDFRLPGVDTRRIWEIARSMKRGGTGYYRSSDFVHIDTGRVRSW